MLDVFKMPGFRRKLEDAFVLYNEKYSIPDTIPALYKYSSLSEYAIKHLIQDGFSLSLISSFNDCYDGNISFGGIKEQALVEYQNDLRISREVGMLPCTSEEQWIRHITFFQEAHRGFCNDSYCLCLSESNESTLMWSHYADCNRGICIEYDFNTIKQKQLYYALFPVCYTSLPIGVYDYIENKMGDFSIELGVMISVLNKAMCWAYEKEWRLVLLNETMNKKLEKYITFCDKIKAKSVTLGQNFLDNMIPELCTGNREHYCLIKTLFASMEAKNIPVYQVAPRQNSFKQNRRIPLNGEMFFSFVEDNQEERSFTLSNRNYLYTSYWEHLGVIRTE